MRDAGERCEQEAEALSTELALDPEVYAPLSRVDAEGEEEATLWYLFRVLRDFRRAGVDKDAPTRARIRALNEELVRIGQEFQRNIRDDVRSIQVSADELEGLPADYASARASGVVTWDSEALKERVRAEQFGFDSQTVRPYFEIGRVLDGILETTARMFGIEYRRLADAPVWHPDVTAWEVVEQGRTVGQFLLDL